MPNSTKRIQTTEVSKLDTMDERDSQPPDKRNPPLRATHTKSPKKAEERFLGVKQFERMNATRSSLKHNAFPKGEDQNLAR